ncbi:MAG: glycosyltransferase family 4 protein, partial [Candidatus Bathyarchaeota archaeon]
RLCFINPTRLGRTVVYGLAKHLVSEKKHEVVILQPGNQHQFARRTSSLPLEEGIEIEYLPAFFLPGIYYNIPCFSKQIKALNELCANHGCEIIQACDYDYLTSLAPIYINKKRGVPIILTTDAMPGYSWSYGNAIVDTVAKQYTFSIGKGILRSYNMVVLLYKKLVDDAKNFGVREERIQLIPNGIEFQKFAQKPIDDSLRRKLSIDEQERVLLFVGRLAKVKKVEILIALTKALITEGLKVKAVIVGDGPSRQYYERLSESIKDNVVFAGSVPWNQIHKYYHIADIFVLPSLSEGLPTVLLEASAASKPCVASNVNGVSDIIVHGETGYLVERPDFNLYLHYVKDLLADENLARRMGAKAAEYVKENFNWDVVVGKYERLYKEILD